MEPFRTLVSAAAPLADSDIDTDIIYPARFLLRLDKRDLQACLFRDRRFDAADRPRADFVLNRTAFRAARILVAGANFGCGSSREHAVWALLDFGIRCVIAPSFGEIFHANCFRSGVLPIRLPIAEYARVLAQAETGDELTIDLETSEIRFARERISFDIDPYRRNLLLRGLDEIGAILAEDAADIAAFEIERRRLAPWLFLDADDIASRLHPGDP